MIWVVAVVFAAAYVLIATEKVNRTAVALAGAGVVVAAGAVNGHDIFFSADTGIDWNVIFLLLGMMIIVGVLKQTGVFEYLAIWAAKRARAKPFRVMVLLCVITAVASALLDNVTTILLITPVTFLVCERLGVPAVPYVIAEVTVSNIGGIATLVGDPPNIIIGSRAGLTYNDFLINMLPVAVVLVIIFCGLCWLLFGRHLRADPERAEAVMQLTEREAITNPSLLVRGLVVLGLVLVAFVLHPVTHMDPSVVALLGAGLLVLVSRLGPQDYLEEVEWETLAFFAGLFIMVGALVKTGVIDIIATALTTASGGNAAAATMMILFGSAVLSGVVDNIPYVATMSPVVSSLTAAGGPLHEHTVLWWALVLGADLGGNATAIGASANVVAVGLARRSGQPISFWQFTKYGLVITGVTVVASAGYLALRYL